MVVHRFTMSLALIFLNQPASLSMRFRQYTLVPPLQNFLDLCDSRLKRKGDSLIFQTPYSSHCNIYTSLPLFSPASRNTNSIAHDGEFLSLCQPLRVSLTNFNHISTYFDPRDMLNAKVNDHILHNSSSKVTVSYFRCLADNTSYDKS